MMETEDKWDRKPCVCVHVCLLRGSVLVFTDKL